jgi:hypothetical protein
MDTQTCADSERTLADNVSARPGIATVHGATTSLMQIRAAELTADNLGQTVKIEPRVQTSLVGRLVSIRQKRVRNAATLETEAELELEVPGDQRIRVGFNAIGVVELL